MENADMVAVPDAQVVYAADNNEASQGASQVAAQYVPQGQPVTIKGPRPNFMNKIPGNEFQFPEGGPINATLADIIVLLPQWFRNPGLLTRFMNNGITAALHYAILEKHRHLDILTEEEAERARDHLSTAYRTNMRKIDRSWTRRKHEVPQGWDAFNMNIANYLPEAAKKPLYEIPPSIKFRDLAVGLKQLPRGDDAGDLTRALAFAMRNTKTNEAGRKFHYVFPEDIHVILEQTGRTSCTLANVDRAVLNRYERALDDAKTMQIGQASGAVQQMVGLTQSLGQLPQQTGLEQQVSTPSYLQRPHQAQQGAALMPYERIPTYDMHHSHVSNPYLSTNTFKPAAPKPYERVSTVKPMRVEQTSVTTHTDPGPSYIGPDFKRPEQHVYNAFRSSAQQAAAAVASQVASDVTARALVQPTGDLPDIPDICKYTGEESNELFDSDMHLQFPKHWTRERQMDGLMAANQTQELGLILPWLKPLFEQDGGGMQQSPPAPVDPPSPSSAFAGHDEDRLFEQDRDAMQQSATDIIGPSSPFSVLAGYYEDLIFGQVGDAMQQSPVDPSLPSSAFVGLDGDLLFGQHRGIMQQSPICDIDPILLSEAFESHEEDGIGDEDTMHDEDRMDVEDNEGDKSGEDDEDDEMEDMDEEDEEDEFFYYRDQK